MSDDTAPHAFESSNQPNVCERCGHNRMHSAHWAQKPDHEVCINCLMTQGKARKLEFWDGAYKCVTMGGCGGVFTASYLNKVSRQVQRLMEAMQLDTSNVIVRGGKLERTNEIEQGERQVILTDDGEPNG